jgi:hypothetical protein
MSAVVERDERVVMVENASYRWACSVMSFGLLMDVAYRSWVRHEAPWDLFGLVILGGMVATVYQGSNRALGRGRVRSMGLTFVLGGVIALLVALSIVLFRR